SVAALNAHGAFTYDLRAVAGPTAALNGGHFIPDPSPGNYTLQLWGQLSGDSNLSNDAMAAGWFNLYTSGSQPLFSTPGSGITSVSIDPVWNVSITGSSSNLSNDGLADWGSNNQTGTVGWSLWQSGSKPATGGAIGHAVNANTWEMLLATITVHISGIALTGQETDINVGVPSVSGVFAYQGIGKYAPVLYDADGIIGHAAAASANLSAGNPVVFAITIPEPASLSLLALGALTMIARRRR
ncbi:MAG TPA: PEP-CTERM sorting domain-containing protein, partial [Phycisphaerae bacterium]|nr:PEP-CTERM sorting domain-containing protein [Phycisphaerae bacterium]